MGEDVEPIERNRAGRDQLLDLFGDQDGIDNFTCCMLTGSSIPMEEATAGPEAEQWREAIEREDRGMEELDVLIREDCPAGMKPLKTRYILTKKIAPDGTPQKFKARRVVQGFNQVYGRDFLETFAPVMGFDTLRIILKLSVENSWPKRTLDCTQAYLNSPLKEAIWVQNPDGTSSRLKKALYGLKQAGLEWNKTLSGHILQRTMWKQSKFDDCLFFARDEKTERIGITAIYVDDIFMTGSWEEEIQSLQQYMLSRFSGTINRNPNMFLGLEIKQYGENRVLHQTRYCKTIIEMVYKGSTRSVSIPLAVGSDLTSRKEEEDQLDFTKYPYRQYAAV